MSVGPDTGAARVGRTPPVTPASTSSARAQARAMAINREEDGRSKGSARSYEAMSLARGRYGTLSCAPVARAVLSAMANPESPRRRGDRVRQTILEWMFPIGGTVVLLIAVLVAIFRR